MIQQVCDIRRLPATPRRLAVQVEAIGLIGDRGDRMSTSLLRIQVRRSLAWRDSQDSVFLRDLHGRGPER
ncbi:hypothetical protein [Micromonospora chalcea]|uniref:hypothetical protein n=1 Tax=Micromonospora chalcea TaxID=1874 RepID=UPI000D487B19|nr:hypothetical protein [Micromonospora chalcea]PPA60727.1 hypothetical protein BAW75_10615 [Micromonospora chalcea]